jgi:hypothetical protein
LLVFNDEDVGVADPVVFTEWPFPEETLGAGDVFTSLAPTEAVEESMTVI